MYSVTVHFISYRIETYSMPSLECTVKLYKPLIILMSFVCENMQFAIERASHLKFGIQ